MCWESLHGKGRAKERERERKGEYRERDNRAEWSTSSYRMEMVFIYGGYFNKLYNLINKNNFLNFPSSICLENMLQYNNMNYYMRVRCYHFYSRGH